MRLSRLAVLSLLVLSAPALAASAAHDNNVTLSSAARAFSETTGSPSLVPVEMSAPIFDHRLEAARPAVQEEEADGPSEVSLGHVVALAFRAVSSRNWSLLGCAMVLGLVYAVRRVGASRMPWLRSDAAGVGLSLLVAAALQVSTAVAAGAPATLSMVVSALLTAAGASGLFSWGQKLHAAHQYATASARTT